MKNIILIGFMGTGKTSVGRLLASRLGRSFIDLDKKIEQEEGRTIPEIFQQDGEMYFRQKERSVVVKASRLTGAVIATGGGAVLDHDNVIRLKNSGILIGLTADPMTILQRTERRNNRPLLNCEDRLSQIEKLLSQRKPFYEVADYTLDTVASSPQQVAEQIIHLLRQGGWLRGRS